MIHPFPLRSKVKMAMCKQHKTRTACEKLAVCLGFMLFAAHQYLRVEDEAVCLGFMLFAAHHYQRVKDEAVCSDFMLFAAHQYLRVEDEALKALISI
ncbi:hypothetical protein DPMN_072442 [Dreissena polymorpha]|uniref:Uncharacterized protein n=1 Tax=Dreissena polymorpha TaxID=45954 RepID=A0A9D3Z688_DREPO|nr:hypothetical protein DPMN_072442 [Dreissena polymorpha]